jgi:hypothetical protein|tara:strand:+ start:487 stop:771 length:285 start_codon:yes stop_codon:yes gene_type:complete
MMEHPHKLNTKLGREDLFESDDILGDFFTALADNDIQALRTIHIPRSDVFYVREKYYSDTGNWVSLDRIERSMFLEGMLSAADVRDPTRARDWE